MNYVDKKTSAVSDLMINTILNIKTGEVNKKLYNHAK